MAVRSLQIKRKLPLAPGAQNCGAEKSAVDAVDPMVTESDPGPTTTVRVEQPLSVSRSRMWRACTEPAELSRWQADMVSGSITAGGVITLSWPRLGLSTHIDVKEKIEEERLVLRHGSTDLVFEVTPSSVVVTHSGVPAGDVAEGVESSWRLSLSVLDHYLRQHDGSDRRVEWFVARADTSPATAHVYFTDPAALSSWLTETGEIRSAGSACSLLLGWGEPLHGRVLSNTDGRDLAISWDDRDASVLAMRTLPAPDSVTERLIVVSWSCWSTPADPKTAQHLQVAVARLQRLLHGGASA